MDPKCTHKEGEYVIGAYWQCKVCDADAVSRVFSENTARHVYLSDSFAYQIGQKLFCYVENGYDREHATDQLANGLKVSWLIGYDPTDQCWTTFDLAVQQCPTDYFFEGVVTNVEKNCYGVDQPTVTLTRRCEKPRQGHFVYPSYQGKMTIP